MKNQATDAGHVSRKQDYGTPHNFLDAVRYAFGPLEYDLAAHEDNHVCDKWLGPGSPIAEGTLQTTLIGLNGNLWLNPPYRNIGDWAKKCAETSADLRFKGSILFLVPASVGSEWFAKWVWPYASVHALRGRLTFRGCTAPFPKDCILAHYGAGSIPGKFGVWDWRKDVLK